ncbi:Hydroxyethylthiazole kinase family-domain-containing protein [Boletus reticuloceps]|uniref:Hydroxyethylthiazole kinase family-domain-containing protein n=1 Tax=Boletus reticuloceps TaxID=495285 RepID=A0A8I3A6X6_9AGAM|nr:Hydroxyethylthiazole kinase family-domain-containing protein [Boletus reticuloceps]
MIDYSLYLVTGRELLPEGKAYCDFLREALEGGVTIVQVREKKADTAEFLHIANESKNLCTNYGVPLIINDRVDIALAVDADGVHLGQTDMPVRVARSLLPPGKIIGVSCNSVDHVKKAVEDGADYVGIGAVWATNTKQLTSLVLGVRAVGPLLSALDGTSVKAVAIGGIKSSNVLRTLHGSVSTTGHRLDGVAVVSEIVSSREPCKSARTLKEVYRSWSNSTKQLGEISPPYTTEIIKDRVADLLHVVKETKPLIHQIINIVVANQSANATLALGASPIMASALEEMYDLSRVLSALLINLGTVTDNESMLTAGRFANDAKKPVVFDPVGVGATEFRRKVAAELLNTWQASVIKGNAGELAALADSEEVQAKGVDSIGVGFANPAKFVRDLARKERCVVALTGAIDWVSDGTTIVKLTNGHKLLGDITGSGCLVGTCIATFCAGAWELAKNEDGAAKLVRGDMLIGALGGILALTIAGERAAVRSNVQGSGTFLPALIDELYNLTPEKIKQDSQVEIVTV